MSAFLFLLGRVVFGAFFVFNGFNHFRGLDAMSQYAASMGVPFAKTMVLVTGAMLVLGGLSIILGLVPRLGALLLVLFLVPVTFQMHGFWNIEDPAMRSMQMGQFLKNLGLLGGALALMGVPAPWPLALASGRRVRRSNDVSGGRLVERHA